MAADERQDRALSASGVALVISSAMIGHVTLDRDWRIVDANAAAAALLEASPDVLVGRRLWEQHPDTWDVDLQRVFESVVLTRRSASIEGRRPGSATPFERRCSPPTPESPATSSTQRPAR